MVRGSKENGPGNGVKPGRFPVNVCTWKDKTGTSHHARPRRTITRLSEPAAAKGFGHDLRREPVEVRKAALVKLLRPKPDGISVCEHIEFDDAEMFFEHACQLVRGHRVEAAWLAMLRSVIQSSLEPASPAVPAATENKQNQYDDDEKCHRIHVRLL
jgi:hypothetical protein